MHAEKLIKRISGLGRWVNGGTDMVSLNAVTAIISEFESAKPPLYKIEVVNGAEGNSVYINDYRVSGPKPWGGGEILCKFIARADDIEEALGKPYDEDK